MNIDSRLHATLNTATMDSSRLTVASLWSSQSSAKRLDSDSVNVVLRLWVKADRHFRRSLTPQTRQLFVVDFRSSLSTPPALMYRVSHDDKNAGVAALPIGASDVNDFRKCMARMSIRFNTINRSCSLALC